MTLYKHFRSKDELILAALRLRDERWRNWFMRAVERRSKEPRERLLAVFDALGEWIGGKDFTGCTFINASAEFTDHDDPIRRAAAEHKRVVMGYVSELAAGAGARDPGTLAMELVLLVEGAVVLAHVAGQTDAASRARKAAETLVAQALA